MSIEQNSNNMAKLAMNKSILREYTNNSNQRIVYLNNNDEFQIQLFNPETFTLGAEISINGEALQGLLVIKPGERIWLERPLVGNNKKFKFETYTVEDSEAVNNAIRNNGEIKIKFYKEKQPTYWSYTVSYAEPIEYKLNTTIDNTLYNNEYGSTCRCKSISSDPVQINANLNSATYFKSDVNCLSTTVNCITSDKADCIYTPICGAAENLTVKANTAYIEPEKAVKETGRIGSGSDSNQKFNTVSKDFETWAYKTEIMQILPMSQKPFTNSDLQKIYCVNCGRKLKANYKFCPYCGAKVE